jgi:hypothetical protein
VSRMFTCTSWATSRLTNGVPRMWFAASRSRCP